jgi:hypothetical protein
VLISEVNAEASVEAGSNTSTVTLRVGGGDEKESLKSDKGMVRSDMSKPALIFFHCKSTQQNPLSKF